MSQITCKKCGYPWSTYTACPNCGSKVPNFDSKKNDPKGMGCFILFIVALIVIVAIVNVFSRGFIYNSGVTIVVVGLILGLFILLMSQNKKK
jgi:hypothetical protein